MVDTVRDQGALGKEHHTVDAATDIVFAATVNGDAYDRLQIQGNGVVKTGAGVAAPQAVTGLTLPQQGAITQTFATADATHAARTAAALTDNSTGTGGTTIAAGVGVRQLAIPIDLASVADGDVLTDFVPGYKFKILKVDFRVTKPVTTAAKLSTLNLEIGSTNLDGGTVALTSANCTPNGHAVAGAAVTGHNTGTATDAFSIEASSTTAFIEGQGVLLITIQNMDGADAIASLAAQCNAGRVDSLDTASLVNTIVDDLQTLALVG